MKSKLPSLPYLIWMVIFIVLPLGLVVFFAFTNKDGGLTLDNLTNVTQFMPVIFRSVWLALISTVICLVISFPISFIISRMMPNKQSTMLMLLLLPMWINFLLRTYAWMTLLESNGVINRILEFFGLGQIEIMNTQSAVVLGMVYNYLPFMILPLYSIMTKIDGSIIEAAQDLGANSFRVLGKVIIPLSIPGIYTGITMVFVPSVSTFIISRMLGGGTNDLIGDIIEQQFTGNSYNPYLGSALALILMIIVLLIMTLLNQFGNEDAAI